MTDLSGQYVGRYYLLERLGEGGMAIVYKAYDTRLERDVAVKIIRRGAFPADALDEISKRFEREAKSLAKLSHPNIVKVHDYGEHNGSPYLVMEYLAGGTLKKLVGKSIPWQEALRLLLPVARGLAHAHQRGILHRDIKPANILITENGDPMLSDFGIAKLFEGHQTTNLTGSGMVIGTPEYMAPEQWTGQPNPQSDLYSLGIVLYEMVAGRKPYVADTPVSLLLKQATEPLPPPHQFVASLPEALELLLIKALARDPQDRFADMNALIHAMEALLTSAPTVQPQHVEPDATRVQLQDGGETVLLSAASSSPMLEGNAIPERKGQGGPASPVQQSRRTSQFGLFAFFGGVGFFVIAGAILIVLILLASILPNLAKPVLTPTVYVAPTPSETPEPELGFTIIEPQEALKIAPDLKSLQEMATEKYSDVDLNRVNNTVTFTVNSKPEVPILWKSGWCAVNDQLLEENLTKITFILEADGHAIPQERWAKRTYEVTSSDSNYKGWKCMEYLLVLRDWKSGTYQLMETISILSSIDDGKVTFDAGYMITKYTVNISE